ncbi:MAG: hypothetical protein K6L76_07700 [Agarilytica sp.]
MKPLDLQLGVSELFAILIPGFLIVVVGIEIFEIVNISDASTNVWFIVSIASYIFGHIFFAIGSQWDKIYDKVKPKGNEPLLNTIDNIRGNFEQYPCENINNYKWSRAFLSKQHPEGYSEVLRHEADSKLFRSLILPIIFTCIFLLISQYWYPGIIAIGMAYIAFARYKDQRFKGCKLAYTHVIVLMQSKQ